MAIIHVNGVDLCYQQDGALGDPSVLLVHGIGCQLIQWPESFVEGLVAAGFHVLRFDNRDVGLSQKMDALGSVDLMELMIGFSRGQLPKPPYTLTTMADDAMALLDALGRDTTHVVGVSMGGMIAQRAAIHHAQRILSLTSIMSSSGALGLPPPDPAAIASITTPPSGSRAEIIAQLRQSWDLIGGPHYQSTRVGMGRMTEAAFDRGRYPPGFLRQMAAIVCDVGRADRLREIRAPSLVIHGDADRLVPLACGEDTAKRIPHAKLKVFPKMGHDLPDPLIPAMLESLIAQLRAAAN